MVRLILFVNHYVKFSGARGIANELRTPFNLATAVAQVKEISMLGPIRSAVFATGLFISPLLLADGHAKSVDDAFIEKQRVKLAENTDGQGFGLR